MSFDKFNPGLKKLLYHPKQLTKIKEAFITAPIHVSVWPTSKCQLNCKYCCCRKAGKNGTEIGLDEFEKCVKVLSAYGTKAIEFSGGGEPLLWTHIDKGTACCKSVGLNLSLITNGIELNNTTPDFLKRFSWVRISYISIEQLEKINIKRIKKYTNVSISYVVAEDEKLHNVGDLYGYAKDNGVIVRLAAKRPCGINIEYFLRKIVSDYHEPFFYSEKERGAPKGCYMPWVRAAIDWKGNFLPCPSIQMSEENEGKIPKSFVLCHMSEIEDWLINNQPKDIGHRCSFCNCGKQINDFIHDLINGGEDVDFV